MHSVACDCAVPTWRSVVVADFTTMSISHCNVTGYTHHLAVGAFKNNRYHGKGTLFTRAARYGACAT